MKYFKIYGIHRTGTNYISALLMKNFNVKVFMNVGGCKHCHFIQYPDESNLLNSVDNNTKRNTPVEFTLELFQKELVYFIVMIKNPYMWIRSIAEFEKKLITPNYVIQKIQTWNDTYMNYKEYIMNGTAYLIKYEQLLKNREQTIQKIIDNFHLSQKYPSIIDINYKLGPNCDSDIERTLPIRFDKSMYIDCKITNYLSTDIIRIINNTIDKSLLDFYQYDMIDI